MWGQYELMRIRLQNLPDHRLLKKTKRKFFSSSNFNFKLMLSSCVYQQNILETFHLQSGVL